jgi:N-acetyl-anhydromuramyl-L-alanine amidase AmpD
VVRAADYTRVYRVIGGYLPFERKSAWTQQTPVRSRLNPAAPYRMITIHHEGRHQNRHLNHSDVARDLSNILAGHRNRRYGDIAYHLIIDPAGRVWEGRSLRYQGAHVADHNRGNIGVMLLGNFEQQSPAGAQLESLHKLTHILSRYFHVPRTAVFGHRDLSQTLCPGRRLYPYVAAMRTG